MDFELKIMDTFCDIESFFINGIKGDKEDFGAQGDMDSANAEDYGCGDMQFEAYDCRPEILEKYHITKQEYQQIADALERGLSFGSCGWCV